MFCVCYFLRLFHSLRLCIEWISLVWVCVRTCKKALQKKNYNFGLIGLFIKMVGQCINVSFKIKTKSLVWNQKIHTHTINVVNVEGTIHREIVPENIVINTILELNFMRLSLWMWIEENRESLQEFNRKLWFDSYGIKWYRTYRTEERLRENCAFYVWNGTFVRIVVCVCMCHAVTIE